MGKESITLSMELAETQCYEFECFEDSYSLTITTQDVGLTQGSLIPKEHSLHVVFTGLKNTASANTNLT